MLKGKPHLHLVLGLGSRTGNTILDREIRLILNSEYEDVKVKDIKSYKDLCNSLGYTLKEYNMKDVSYNLEKIKETRRYQIIVRER